MENNPLFWPLKFFYGELLHGFEKGQNTDLKTGAVLKQIG